MSSYQRESYIWATKLFFFSSFVQWKVMPGKKMVLLMRDDKGTIMLSFLQALKHIVT